jgi:hypothetical protein
VQLGPVHAGSARSMSLAGDGRVVLFCATVRVAYKVQLLGHRISTHAYDTHAATDDMTTLPEPCLIVRRGPIETKQPRKYIHSRVLITCLKKFGQVCDG